MLEGEFKTEKKTGINAPALARRIVKRASLHGSFLFKVSRSSESQYEQKMLVLTTFAFAPYARIKVQAEDDGHG